MSKAKILISSESTIDLPKELLDQLGIITLPYSIIVGDEELKDGEIGNEELFKKVDALGVLPKTQAINEYMFQQFFKEQRQHYDYIIHFSLSSGLTSSVANAIQAAKELTNVHIVDTLALSTGIALLALKARDLVEEGNSYEEIIEKINKLIPCVQTSFLIDKTNYLYKGGRCSLLSFIAASVLNIKPQIVMAGGKLAPAKKYRGHFDRAIIKYVNDTLEEFNKPDLQRVFLTCTTAPQSVLDEIEGILKARGFQNIYQTRAGCTISSHCGPNTLGILYFNDIAD